MRKLDSLMVFHFRLAINASRIQKRFFDLNQSRVNSNVTRRAGVSVLLSVCLVTFLCPDVAKPNVITTSEAKAPNCCAKMSGCKMTNEQIPQHDRCGGGDASQSGSCCPISCSTLILFCPVSDQFPPRFNGRTFAIQDATASARIERPPTPPPRV